MHVFDKGAEVERGPTAGSAADEVAPARPTGPASDGVAGVLGMLGVAEPALAGTLEHLAALAADLVAQADGLVVVVHRAGGPSEVVEAGSGAGAVERLQRDLADGPAPDARRSGRVLLSGDLAAEPRWPRLAARVGATGLRSALCIPLSVRGTVLGHVGVYAVDPDAFDDRERHLALRWSGTAAQACTEALRAEDARETLRSGLPAERRVEVDRAVAVLVAEEAVGPAEALAVLQLMARTEGRDLVAVARAVVAAGPGDDAAPAARPAG